MPSKVLMLIAHYLCHSDSQGWTFSTVQQEASPLTDYSNIQWSLTHDAERSMDNPGICNVMLPNNQPCFGRHGVSWQVFLMFLAQEVKKQIMSAFLFLGLKGIPEVMLENFHSWSQWANNAKSKFKVGRLSSAGLDSSEHPPGLPSLVLVSTA